MQKISFSKYEYIPMLAIRPAEMSAIEELPEKDKDLILPIFPVKGWVGSHSLSNTLARIKKSIGDRPWIADVDDSFPSLPSARNPNGTYKRPVFEEVLKLMNSTNGYQNWCDFLENIPEAIPTLQLSNLNELNKQIENIEKLDRGLVVKLDVPQLKIDKTRRILELLAGKKIENIFIVFYFGKITREYLKAKESTLSLLIDAKKNIPQAILSFCASSFPMGFSKEERGENPIVERQLYLYFNGYFDTGTLKYSDLGSARASEQTGGGGIPVPRIDYPLKNDWRFIRKELEEGVDKDVLYTRIARELIQQEYWCEELKVWGTQLITLTAKDDDVGITSAAKATAVRINIHLYNQLHYFTPVEDIDSDEDWVD